MSVAYETYRAQVEEAIRAYCDESAGTDTVTRSMSYSLLAGGKRIRPVLLLMFCDLCGGEARQAMPFALALEMIHTYSLIHDDLPCMDNDDLRRGKPSNHKVFGEDMALLAGDALLTEAFTLASGTKGIEPDRVYRALAVLGEKAGWRGMVGGQVMDLASQGKQLSGEELERLDRLKTGALLQAAAQIGCLLGGGNDEQVRAAAQYGEYIGVAFQIVDDILDVTASAEKLGKPIGSDAKNQKCTYVSLLGLESAKARARELTDRAIAALALFLGDTRELTELTRQLLDRQW